MRWLLALFLMAFATPAMADWQYTRWGMTVDEVVAASNGSAKKIKDRKDDRVWDLPRLVVGTAQEGDVTFNVEFYFENNKLRLIRYAPTGTMDCLGEEKFLLERFGPAESSEKVKEFRSQSLVLLKTASRVWSLPGGDQMTFNIFRIERPDLPSLTVKPMCVVLIEPTLPSAPKA